MSIQKKVKQKNWGLKAALSLQTPFLDGLAALVHSHCYLPGLPANFSMNY